MKTNLSSKRPTETLTTIQFQLNTATSLVTRTVSK